MLRVTLEQWRMFRAVVQYGGFNQASQGIHKSQSSIHNAVGKIESSLNVKLFEIEGRRTILTEAGELMLKRANFLLDEADRKSTRLNSSHVRISYAVFCLKKKRKSTGMTYRQSQITYV